MNRSDRRIDSKWEIHNKFKWALTLSKAYTDGEVGKSDYFSFWVKCEPTEDPIVLPPDLNLNSDDEDQENGSKKYDSSLCIYANLKFEIVPYNSAIGTSFMEHSLHFSSSALFHTDIRISGWDDFFPWKLLFDPNNEIVSPTNELTVQLHIEVLAEYRIVPTVSEEFPLILPAKDLPYANYFSPNVANFSSEKPHDSVILHRKKSDSTLTKHYFHKNVFNGFNGFYNILRSLTPEEVTDLDDMEQDGVQFFFIKDGFHISAALSILRFFYRREVTLHLHLTQQIYRVAYECQLKAIGKAFISRYLSAGVAVKLVPSVLRYEDTDDKAIVINEIRDKFAKVLKLPSFYELSAKDFKFIVDSEHINCEEDEIAKAVFKWAKRKIGQQKTTNYQPTIDEIHQLLDAEEMTGSIRYTHLKNPEKYLPAKDLKWLEFARDVKSSQYKFKTKFDEFVKKRSGKPAVF